MHLAEVEYYTFSCLNVLFCKLTAPSDTEYWCINDLFIEVLLQKWEL
jgi:hypothetical protein